MHGRRSCRPEPRPLTLDECRAAAAEHNRTLQKQPSTTSMPPCRRAARRSPATSRRSPPRAAYSRPSTGWCRPISHDPADGDAASLSLVKRGIVGVRHGRAAPVRRAEDRQRQQARPAGRRGRAAATAKDRSRGARTYRHLFLAGGIAQGQPFDHRSRGAATGGDTPPGRTLGRGRARDHERPAARGTAQAGGSLRAG